MLRAIGVLEWTGEEGKPKTSRLVPVTVYDGEALQDGNVYLARPQPLALAMEVEYELEKNGKPIGLYDIKNAGQQQGTWVGFGSWKATPSAAPKPVTPILAEGGEADSDRPVLHRKHAQGAPGGGSGKEESGSGSSAPASPSDPDRPTLHKKTAGTDTTSTMPDPAPDPDRPTLHGKTKPSAVASDEEPASNVTDPDRPRLKRGKSAGNGPEVLPSLMGLPPDMQQAVAVSDARNRPDHPWNFAWANPGDEAKMKEALQAIAREALGLKSPTTSAAPKRASGKSKSKPASPLPPPLPLADEQFRVFELAYGSGATLVFTAHTDASPTEQKFVTLVAQPDLYGNVRVLLKSVTDGSHLDETPRLRLVDAVDAMADNRGELLFELRGATQRQFALYRVLRGSAEKIFVTGGGEFGVAPGQ